MKKQTMFNIIVTLGLALSLLFNGLAIIRLDGVEKKVDDKEFREWINWTENEINTLYNNGTIFKDHLNRLNKLNGFEEITESTRSSN